MISGIRRQVRCRLTGERSAATAPSLVEDDRPIARRIEISSAVRGGRRTGTAVQPDCRETVGRADDLPIHPVTFADIEVATVVWLYGRVHARNPLGRVGSHEMNTTGLP